MKKKLGILMLDTKFPRIPGDVGNEHSFSFEIIKKVITGADPKRVVVEADPMLLEPFIHAAKELEQEGAAAITTSCGFLAMFQKELSNAVSIPVFSSSLLQVPLVYQMLGAGKIVGIMTANSKTLGNKHFKGVGIETIPKVVYGMENLEFGNVFVGNNVNLNQNSAEKEMITIAKKMIQEHPEVGAIVLECTNMPPYSKAVQNAFVLSKR